MSDVPTESRLPISVLVQTKNEEAGIAHCLDGLAAFDEIVVVDSGSIDRTREIAESMGVRVELFTWNRQYPKKKQWQLDNLRTRNEWILFIDADETPSEALIAEIRVVFNAGVSANIAAFDIDLNYVFAGQLLRHGHRVTKRCLVHRRRVRFPIVDDLDAPGMGELEGHYQPKAEGVVGHLRSRILHNDQDPIRTWFDRHNKYSDWEAFLRTRSVVRSDVARARTLKGRIFDRVPFKPALFFTYAYLLRGGFLDGRAGFDYAFALSMYYWQIGLKVRERMRASVR
jgi:glycosyltransferase involved in cell wall biosynthesis